MGEDVCVIEIDFEDPGLLRSDWFWLDFFGLAEENGK